MKIVFMGTSNFGIAAFAKVIATRNKSNEVVGVYTKAPSIQGRKKALVKSQVHIFAENNSLNVFTPPNLRDQYLEQFLELKPDLVIVAAYGIILNKKVLAAPKYGCINLHPSLLPRWRGAAPIQRTIMAGDNKTAMCIMQMDEGLDTGDIILQEEVNLNNEINFDELNEKLSIIGANLTIKAIDLIENGTITRTPQSSDGITYANKITVNDEIINWGDSVKSIHCKIRALSQSPGAKFKYKDQSIKIIKANYIESSNIEQNSFRNYTNAFSGEIINNKLAIKCGDGGILLPQFIQRSGGKILHIDDFMRGEKNLNIGVVL